MLINETYEEYASRPGLRSSDMKKLYNNPAEYFLSQKEGYKPKPQSDAMGFGEYLHAMLLEPERMDKFAIMPDGLDGRTKEGKAFAADNADKNIISLADAEMAAMLAWKCRNHGLTKSLFVICSKEVSISGFLEEYPAKARFDMVSTDNAIIADLKTTRCSSVEDFIVDLLNFDYDLQAVFYQAVFQSVYGVVPEWYWLAASTASEEVFVLRLADMPEIAKCGERKMYMALKNLRNGSVKIQPEIPTRAQWHINKVRVQAMMELGE